MFKIVGRSPLIDPLFGIGFSIGFHIDSLFGCSQNSLLFTLIKFVSGECHGSCVSLDKPIQRMIFEFLAGCLEDFLVWNVNLVLFIGWAVERLLFEN